MDTSRDMSGCLLRGVDLWTSSGCLLRRVDLDFPVGVNRGGYYYDVQGTHLFEIMNDVVHWISDQLVDKARVPLLAWGSED